MFNLSLQIYDFQAKPLTFVWQKKPKAMTMKSILIVEDDITYGMMLKTWLGKKGFNVASASNVTRARKHIETEDVDLILSDLRLPDHDGTEPWPIWWWNDGWPPG